MVNKETKIAYVMDELITCGGCIVPFEHCRELRKRGVDAFIVANGANMDLQSEYPDVPVGEIDKRLKNFTENDVIIAVWWPQVPELEKYKGRKIQLVQGNDLAGDVGDDYKKRCIETRQSSNWEVIAVSKYAGDWTMRPFKIVPNGISNKFFKVGYNIKRDIDILIEGNDEENKNIEEAIKLAKQVTDSIVWLGRETSDRYGVETITNPPQERIPEIYQRAKVFLKLSKSEGFCLPILEAMASGCLVVTKDMGGNDFCRRGENCIYYPILGYEDKEREKKIVLNGYETAKQYTWEKSIDNLTRIIEAV
jgi:glycosyltransferase involved in cell wall biosynthesis